MDQQELLDHTAIIRLIAPQLDEAKRHATELSEVRRKWYLLYRGEGYPAKPGWSSTVDTIIQNAVEWMKPSFVNIFTSDYFKFTTKDPDTGEALKKYVDFKLFREQEGEQIVEDLVHSALVGHYGVSKVYYKKIVDREEVELPPLMTLDEAAQVEASGVQLSRYDVGTVPHPVTGEPVDAVGNAKGVREVVRFEGACWECVPPEELYYLPGYKSMDECPFVAHRVRRSLDYVRRKEQDGEYLPGTWARVQDKAGKGSDDVSVEMDAETQERLDADGLTDASYGGFTWSDRDAPVAPNSEVYIWECYCKLDLDGDGLLEDAIVHICNGVVLKEPQVNPYKGAPFVLHYASREPWKMHGQSVAATLEQEQKASTYLTRLMLDSTADGAFNTIVTGDAATQRALSQRGPADVVLVPAGGQYSVLERKNAGVQVIPAVEHLRSRVENKTGVTSYNQGIDADSLNKTATGITQIMTAAQQRQQLVAKRLARGFKEVLRRVVEIVRMYGDEQGFIRAGVDPQSLNLEDLDPRTDISIDVGVGPQEQAKSANAINEFLLFAMQGGGLQMGITTPEHVRKAWVAKGNFLDVDLSPYMLTEEELQAQAMQQQMQAQAMQQAQMEQAAMAMPPQAGPMSPPEQMPPPEAQAMGGAV